MDEFAEPAECWNVRRSKHGRPFTVCKGEKAWEHGDSSVGIFGGEVEVLAIYPGEKGVSALVQYPGEEPYEEDIRMFQFAEEVKDENMHDLKMSLDAMQSAHEDELEKLKEEYRNKYGENFKSGQRIRELRPFSDRTGKIVDVDRETKIKVLWDGDKHPTVEHPAHVADLQAYKNWEDEWNRYNESHDVMLSAKERFFKTRFR